MIHIRVATDMVRPSESEKLRALLDPHLEGFGVEALLDLKEVEYLGSSVIAVLLTFIRKIREREGKIHVQVGSEDVYRTLLLTRVDQLVDIELVEGE